MHLGLVHGGFRLARNGGEDIVKVKFIGKPTRGGCAGVGWMGKGMVLVQVLVLVLGNCEYDRMFEEYRGSWLFDGWSRTKSVSPAYDCANTVYTTRKYFCDAQYLPQSQYASILLLSQLTYNFDV